MFSWLSSQREPLQLPEGAVLIDVRSPMEFRNGHIVGAVNWPLDQLPEILEKQKPDVSKPCIVYCAHGPRAGMAKTVLMRTGFKEVINAGGINGLIHLGVE
ncbi:rhodanese-related sulfurtransferase [Gynuella sunshinyii YC6258]|uniref:Rhodanese-related sulfurtransferase n=2 Tax=Gynuella sunshinyii TaxID=1445505 RepID=A0A0C5VPN9_9GAMM|nr:rhodanese-related sulfurtransferase [Gynuella sunshinyii YC6258]